MMRHRLKGKVRELRNIVERGVLVGKEPEVTREDLGLVEQNLSGEAPSSAEEILHPPFPPEGVDLGMAHETVDRHFFREALLVAGGNETQAAQLLRINYSTFRYRRRKLGV
jgi:DNA-binding NtrC family response regulator